jgi:hypothetical protein
MNEIINKLDQHLKNVYVQYYYDNTRTKTEYMKSAKGEDGGNCVSLSIMLLDEIKIDFPNVIFLYYLKC